MQRQPATTGLQINRHRDGACSTFWAAGRLACAPGAATALVSLVVAAPGAQARRPAAQKVEHAPKIHFYVHNCSRILRCTDLPCGAPRRGRRRAALLAASCCAPPACPPASPPMIRACSWASLFSLAAAARPWRHGGAACQTSFDCERPAPPLLHASRSATHHPPPTCRPLPDVDSVAGTVRPPQAR
jgi:hypothetical protein